MTHEKLEQANELNQLINDAEGVKAVMEHINSEYNSNVEIAVINKHGDVVAKAPVDLSLAYSLNVEVAQHIETLRQKFKEL